MLDQDERRYQVFVSSTFKDLEEERQKVLQAILGMKGFPAGMELFPSADDDQWEFIKREIESSDYYIVIVAGKYGSLAPDGISFTEKEYDYAVEIKKPVMGFLFHDLDDLKSRDFEVEEERRKRLKEFRAKVGRGKLIKKYKNSDELKGHVVQALAHAFQQRPEIGWIRATNARRVEDLDKITQLQTAIMDLRAQNEALRRVTTTGRELLEQGDDVVDFNIAFEWRFYIQLSFDFNHYLKTQIAEAVKKSIRTTWNELFVVVFDGHADRVETNSLYSAFRQFITQRVEAKDGLEQHGIIPIRDVDPAIAQEARRLSREYPNDISICNGVVNLRGELSPRASELERIISVVRLRFQALDYINVDGWEMERQRWTLRPAGLIHLSLLLSRAGGR